MHTVLHRSKTILPIFPVPVIGPSPNATPEVKNKSCKQERKEKQHEDIQKKSLEIYGSAIAYVCHL